jgi:hypothetical protein
MKRRLLACATAAFCCLAAYQSAARATTLDEIVARLDALEASNHRLERENAEFGRRLGMASAAKATPNKDFSGQISREVARQINANHANAFASNSLAPANNSVPVSVTDSNAVARAFLEKDKTSKLNFRTPNGEILLYGNLDVSVDGITKGISQKGDDSRHPPIGNVG